MTSEAEGEAFTLAAVPPIEPKIDRFLFCRHGQTAGNFSRIIQGPDIELNETGLAQAAAAGEKLKGVAFREIFCSDMRRAKDTGEAIARATGKPITFMPDLRERFFGSLIGTTSTTLDWLYDPPEGETFQGFIDRTKRGVSQIVCDETKYDEPPLIVSHGGVLRVIVAALGAIVDEPARQNATPLEIYRERQGWHVSIL